MVSKNLVSLFSIGCLIFSEKISKNCQMMQVQAKGEVGGRG